MSGHLFLLYNPNTSSKKYIIRNLVSLGVHFKWRDSPSEVHFKWRDGPNGLHFKQRDSPSCDDTKLFLVGCNFIFLVFSVMWNSSQFLVSRSTKTKASFNLIFSKQIATTPFFHIYNNAIKIIARIFDKAYIY